MAERCTSLGQFSAASRVVVFRQLRPSENLANYFPDLNNINHAAAVGFLVPRSSCSACSQSSRACPCSAPRSRYSAYARSAICCSTVIRSVFALSSLLLVCVLDINLLCLLVSFVAEECQIEFGRSQCQRLCLSLSRLHNVASLQIGLLSVAVVKACRTHSLSNISVCPMAAGRRRTRPPRVL